MPVTDPALRRSRTVAQRLGAAVTGLVAATALVAGVPATASAHDHHRGHGHHAGHGHGHHSGHGHGRCHKHHKHHGHQGKQNKHGGRHGHAHPVEIREAIAIAEGAVPGKVTAAEVEEERLHPKDKKKRKVWEVEVKRGKITYDVLIDPRTGCILKVEKDD
ncbi:PepSY domain-containing protein [Streptomyces sp. S07_1.15]|uniref:PepSY domain-containing protein n=1 Tax=Streptomyces sp. S07_1.15 TaxID=2873925 RepID=UPI001D15C897|nr:PepSY domain-containing protein [Streptomyces sp. S07_1.15]MCC3652429.1 PepSY domain-containing protein [Streptomyces sp. S07_1.15]